MKIKANVLKIKQEDGTWVSVPAIVGEKGDRGDDGINGYQYAFEVIDGNLIMTYQDYTPQPNLYIDENGNLILEVNNG